jgi:hypothetical protein
MQVSDEALNDAILQAANEIGFPEHYRSTVRPLVRNPNGRWPRCCGAGCDPCADSLIEVAKRACALLGTPRTAPLS